MRSRVIWSPPKIVRPRLLRPYRLRLHCHALALPFVFLGAVWMLPILALRICGLGSYSMVLARGRLFAWGSVKRRVLLDR